MVGIADRLDILGIARQVQINQSINRSSFQCLPPLALLRSLLLVPIAAANASNEADDEAGDEQDPHHNEHDHHPRLQSEATVV